MPILTSLLFILFLIATVVIYRCNKIPFTPHPFGTKETLPLRGIMILAIMMCHIVPYVIAEYPFLKEFGNYGIFCVGIFFFLNGYGLMYSFLHKQNYLNGFLQKRLPKILVPIIMVTVIFQVIEAALGNFSWMGLYEKLSVGLSISPYAWYVYTILFFYLAFYFVFKYVPQIKISIAIMWIITGGYIYTVKKLGWGENWYISIIPLPMGILYAYKEQLILHFIQWKPRRYINYAFAAFVIVFGYSLMGSYYHFPAWGTLIFNVSPLFIVAIMYVLSFGKASILRFTGKISYEFYITHGIFIVYGKNFLPHNWIFIVFVIACSYLSAWLLHRVCMKILK